jgi:myo-inositol catabolism protein IolC
VTDALFVLAFDHRESLVTSFFGVDGPPSDDVVTRARAAKDVIAEGLLGAIAEGGVARASAAALVDVTYGANAIERLRGEGVRLGVPVEASGADELTFEVDDWRARLAAIDPAWAKVLVRYNPDGDAERNARQRARLRELTQHCTDSGRDLMLELLVPPEPDQAGPAFDTEVRPGLVVRAIEELRGDSTSADVWKVEGLERGEDCQRVAWAAGGSCVVLGRGADAAAVERWLRASAGVPGFVGFAIGRSIWWDPLRAFFEAGASPGAREAAVAAIAARYVAFVRVLAAPADPPA